MNFLSFLDVGVSKNPCLDSYPGTKPFSEIEVVNIKTFSEGLRGKMVLYFDVHAYGEMILLPLAYNHNKHYRNEKDIVSMHAIKLYYCIMLLLCQCYNNIRAFTGAYVQYRCAQLYKLVCCVQ